MQESVVFLVRVQCRRKESSRSLSHLLMSFLFTACWSVDFIRLSLYVCLSVRVLQMTIQKQTSPNFTHRHRSGEGHKVKGQGHATTTMGISANPGSLIHLSFSRNRIL